MFEKTNNIFARVAQWWSIALPRRGPRVRIPCRAFFERKTVRTSKKKRKNATMCLHMRNILPLFLYRTQGELTIRSREVPLEGMSATELELAEVRCTAQGTKTLKTRFLVTEYGLCYNISRYDTYNKRSSRR